MSFYQTLKLILVDIFDVSKDGFHIVLGFVVYLIFTYIFKISPASWKALVPTFIFSLILELVDYRDSSVYAAHYDFIDSIHDMVLTNLLPLLNIIFLRLHKNKHFLDGGQDHD